MHQTSKHERLAPAGLVPVERMTSRGIMRSTDARSAGTVLRSRLASAKSGLHRREVGGGLCHSYVSAAITALP